jgi:hypothetical protein
MARKAVRVVSAAFSDSGGFCNRRPLGGLIAADARAFAKVMGFCAISRRHAYDD